MYCQLGPQIISLEQIGLKLAQAIKICKKDIGKQLEIHMAT